MEQCDYSHEKLHVMKFDIMYFTYNLTQRPSWKQTERPNTHTSWKSFQPQFPVSMLQIAVAHLQL